MALTYNNASSFDGTGAQMQRILGVYSICKFLRIPYVHSPISEMIITPLDPFQSEGELTQYLSRLNSFIELPTFKADSDSYSRREIQTITPTNLLKIRLHSKLATKKSELVAISNPFKVVNRMPDIYRLAIKDLPVYPLSNEKKRIALHYRRGSNTLDVLPGESKPRALENSWYINVLEKYTQIWEKAGIDFSIDVYTDMPKESFVYYPMEFQSHLWSYEPRYRNGKVEVLGEDLKETLFMKFQNNLIVHHGGDPLDGLLAMSQADLLIISRSSYSYVAGLMNRHGKIIVPTGFWHKELKNWIIEP
jgi:hypothetical protein